MAGRYYMYFDNDGNEDRTQVGSIKAAAAMVIREASSPRFGAQQLKGGKFTERTEYVVKPDGTILRLDPQVIKLHEMAVALCEKMAEYWKACPMIDPWIFDPEEMADWHKGLVAGWNESDAAPSQDEFMALHNEYEWPVMEEIQRLGGYANGKRSYAGIKHGSMTRKVGEVEPYTPVRVTEDHIYEGCHQDSQACPVYLALQAAGIDVFDVTACEIRTETNQSYELPEWIKARIEEYDHCSGEMSPFWFMAPRLEA